MFMVEKMITGDISSEAWENTYKKYLCWKEEMVKGVMTPKTHVMGELKKYAVYATLTRYWSYISRTHLGNGSSRNILQAEDFCENSIEDYNYSLFELQTACRISA